MDDSKFWLGIWKLVATAICVLITTIGGCTAHTNYRMAELVKGGSDPLEVGCLYDSSGSSGKWAVCGVKAALPSNRQGAK